MRCEKWLLLVPAWMTLQVKRGWDTAAVGGIVCRGLDNACRDLGHGTISLAEDRSDPQ